MGKIVKGKSGRVSEMCTQYLILMLQEPQIMSQGVFRCYADVALEFLCFPQDGLEGKDVASDIQPLLSCIIKQLCQGRTADLGVSPLLQGNQWRLPCQTDKLP